MLPPYRGKRGSGGMKGLPRVQPWKLVECRHSKCSKHVANDRDDLDLDRHSIHSLAARADKTHRGNIQPRGNLTATLKKRTRGWLRWKESKDVIVERASHKWRLIQCLQHSNI